jgi:hypothetical protein
MSNKTVEFAEASAGRTTNNNSTPWKRDTQRAYEDLVFKPDYAARRLRFPEGQTWMRILPPLRGSVHGWMLGIHALEFDGGRFAHPRTLTPNAKCAFDRAYTWALEHTPHSLYSKTNKAGLRLLPNPLAAFWVALEEEGRMVARLFLASAYDGSRGGMPGLGWQIWHLSQQHDEDGNLVTDLTHPEKGVLVGVEKTKAPGAKYPGYRLTLGRQPAPADSFIAKMEPEEAAAIVPLEDTIRILSPEEEWRCLSKIVPPENLDLIKSGI